MLSHLGILFMRLIAPLPLAWVRALGTALGWLLYAVIVPRRRVVRRNLALCFPGMNAREREAMVRRVFERFAQAWLDRSWLWHGSEQVVRRRLVLTGAVDELGGHAPTLVFAPHFVGMDAGVTAMTLHVTRRMVGIYTTQSNPVLNAWMLRGRSRFGDVHAMSRSDGVRALVATLRAGHVMVLLPDMNFGPEESIFVPFFGVQAATVPSLSRFAKLGRAKVVPVVTRMTAAGYTVQVHEGWKDFPSDDVVADTARMNAELERYIGEMPDQYYWVHKRFKTRPPGEPSVY